MEIKRVPLTANKVYDAYNQSNHMERIVYGSSSSGKSYHVFRHEFMKFLSIPGYNIIALRKTQKSTRISILPLLQKFVFEFSLQDIVTINNTTGTFHNLVNGNMIYLLGMKDKTDREKLKSATFKNGNAECIILEEATEFAKEDYIIVSTRLRGKGVIKNKGHRKSVVLIFNPVSEQHWIKDFFKLDIDHDGNATTTRKDTFVLRANYTHNRFLEPEDRERLERMQYEDRYFYDVYCLGKWGVLSQDNVVIPYSIIWKAFQNVVEPVGDINIGLDAAGMGKDRAMIGIEQGGCWLDALIYQESDGNQLAAGVMWLIERYRGVHTEMRVDVKIDITGEGASCFDILQEKELINVHLHDISFGGTDGVKNPKRYANMATEMYFEAKEKIPHMQLIPGQEKIYSELSTRRYKIKWNNSSQYEIESKDDWKKDYGPGSPDGGDMFVLMCYNTTHQGNRSKHYKKKKEYARGIGPRPQGPRQIGV